MEKAVAPSGGTGGSGGRKPFKKYRGNRGPAQAQPSAAAPGAPPATANPPQSERAAEKPPKPEVKPAEKRKPTKPAAAGSSAANNTTNNTTNNSSNNNSKATPKCKILIRKLPASKDYSREQFESCVTAVVNKLGLDAKNFHVDHFIEGKISRKRGPVFGAGYVVCSDPSQCQVFLQQCPSQVPFLLDDMNGQPEVSAAPYPKPFKVKEKVDKLAGTYESDPEFLVFKQQLENPSARSEAQPPTTPQPTLEEKMRTNALLQFLREKAERRLRERSGASHSKKSSTSKESKKAKQLNAAESAKALEAKLHKREKRRENKAKRKAEAQNAASATSAGGAVGTAASMKESKKKKTRGRKEKKAKKLATTPSDATDGAAHQSTPQAATPKKFTILKREAVAGQVEAMPPASVESASGKSGGGGRRGSKKRGGGGGGGGIPAPQPSEVA